MFDSLFGTEGSLIVRVVIALIIVLGLIALAFWLFRRFGVSGVSAGATRGRQPRLAVVDAASVDSRRRLVLVRRDNVEHLIMIGGPSDIVVEQNIVRAVPVTAPREMPVPRTPGAVEAATSRGPLADEAPHMEPPAPPPPRAAPEFPRIPRPEPAPRPPRVAESLARLGMPPSVTSRPPLPEPPPVAPAPEPVVEPLPSSSSAAPADAALASMAQRLEAALRRPPGAPESGKAPEVALEVPPSDSPATAPQAAPPASKASSDIDSLQEEMANILGRRLTKE